MIVTDAGPLHYLILIETTTILPALYKRVYVPYDVGAELQHAGTPAKVQRWMQDRPAWMTLIPPGPRKIFGAGIHAGEAAAIALAEELRAEALLIDDLRERREATRRGLNVIGTLGLLYEAALAEKVDFEDRLKALEKTNFHVSDAIKSSYLERWRSMTR